MNTDKGTRAAPRQLAFYGKGGIGKSTIVANISAALSSSGLKVLQIGCDPKRDSSRPFWGEVRPRTVMDLLRERGGKHPTPADYISTAAVGVDYVEVGGPEPGVGCAGRGILKMFELMDEAEVFSSGYDVIIYDVLGDVVCGGFGAPMRTGKAQEVYVVASGEFMTLYAANNICKGVANYAVHRSVRLGGIVLNCRNVPGEVEIATALAEAVGSHVVGVVPRDPLVSLAERARRTVVEMYPDSPLTQTYRALARQVIEAPRLGVPTPLDDEALEALYFETALPAEAP